MSEDRASYGVFTIEQQVVCLMVEISRRETCYPALVASKQMLQAKADHEIGAMRAAVNTLSSLLKEKTNA
jgi:hypothetical protein